MKFKFLTVIKEMLLIKIEKKLKIKKLIFIIINYIKLKNFNS